MNFATKDDLLNYISTGQLTVVSESDDNQITDVIETAIQESLGYMAHRYDTSTIFADYKIFSVGDTYAIGDRIFWEESAYDDTATYSTNDLVSYERKIYQSIGGNTAEAFDASKWTELAYNKTTYTCRAASMGNLPSDTDYFTATGKRDAKLLEVVCCIAIFHLYTSVTPRNIPEVAVGKYDNALNWLIKVQRGIVTMPFPIYSDVDKGQRLAYGNNVRLY